MQASRSKRNGVTVVQQVPYSYKYAYKYAYKYSYKYSYISYDTGKMERILVRFNGVLSVKRIENFEW